LEVGQEGEYVLILRNTGTDSAGDVVVTAMIPDQMQATDAKGPSKESVQPDKVTFAAVALKPGEELRYSIFVKALAPGDVRFRVEITSSVLTAGPLREEASTPIIENP